MNKKCILGSQDGLKSKNAFSKSGPIGHTPLVPSIALWLFDHHTKAGLLLAVTYLIVVFTSDRDS